MDWSQLPEHIVVQILSELILSDRYNASLTCKTWNLCFGSSYLWQTVHFEFFTKKKERLLLYVDKYGHFMKNVIIELDQSLEANRLNSLKVLEVLSKLPDRRLSSLTVRFTANNPLFYAGTEFVDALKLLFGPTLVSSEDSETVGSVAAQLTYVNLEHLDVAYDNCVFDNLSENNPKLEMLNIQNQVLVCKVTCDCTLRLVQRCPYLREMHLFHSCLSDQVLLAFAKNNRPPTMERLSLKCRIEEKYHPDLSNEAWSAFKQAQPRLQVRLIFDHTCPQDRVLDIMQPGIPVVDLQLDTFTMLHQEVLQATQCYCHTLHSLTLRTMSSRMLCDALVYMATHCKLLRKLYVYCVIPTWTKNKLLELCPKLRETGNYILKDVMEPEPWVVGIEEDYW